MLENATKIRDSALRQLNEQGIEALMESVDYKVHEFEEAYRELRYKVGQERAKEIALDYINLAF